MAGRPVFCGADAAIRDGSTRGLLATGAGAATGVGTVVIADVVAGARVLGHRARPR